MKTDVAESLQNAGGYRNEPLKLVELGRYHGRWYCAEERWCFLALTLARLFPFSRSDTASGKIDPRLVNPSPGLVRPILLQSWHGGAFSFVSWRLSHAPRTFFVTQQPCAPGHIGCTQSPCYQYRVDQLLKERPRPPFQAYKPHHPA